MLLSKDSKKNSSSIPILSTRVIDQVLILSKCFFVLINKDQYFLIRIDFFWVHWLFNLSQW